MKPRNPRILLILVASMLGMSALAIKRLPSDVRASQVADTPTPLQDPLCTKSGQFCVNRETSSGTCHVQEATEQPQFGPNLKGPFGSRTDGNKAMCKLYDPASDDPAKCGAVAPQGVCDSKRPAR